MRTQTSMQFRKYPRREYLHACTCSVVVLFRDYADSDPLAIGLRLLYLNK